MDKKEIVKFLRWLGDCYGMDDQENAERVATEYLKEHKSEALNIDDVIKTFTAEQLEQAHDVGFHNGCEHARPTY